MLRGSYSEIDALAAERSTGEIEDGGPLLALGAEQAALAFKVRAAQADGEADASGDVEAFSVNAKDGMRVAGDARVDGDLTVGGAVAFDAAAGQAAPAEWGIRRHGPDGEELRIELGSGGGRLVVGWWGTGADGKPSFVEALVVSADGSVTVKGDLIVGGAISAEKGQAAPELGARAAELGVAAMLSGIAAGTGFSSEAPAAGQSPPASTVAAMVAEQPEAVAQTLAEQQPPGLIDRLIELLGGQRR